MDPLVADSDDPHKVRDVLDRIEAIADQDDVTGDQLLTAFGETSFVPLLMLPALLVVSPLSGIPLFSSVCGLSIAIIAGQMLAGRDHIWLPGWIRRRHISGKRLAKGAAALHRVADWLDRHSRRRFSALSRPPFAMVPMLCCLFAGLAMPFLEAVPFSSSLLGAAVLCIAVGFLARDGLYFVSGAALIAVAASIPVTVLNGIFGG